MTKHIQWDGQLSQEGFDILKERVAVSSAYQSWLHHHDQRQGWIGTEVRSQRTQP